MRRKRIKKEREQEEVVLPITKGLGDALHNEILENTPVLGQGLHRVEPEEVVDTNLGLLEVPEHTEEGASHINEEELHRELLEEALDTEDLDEPLDAQVLEEMLDAEMLEEGPLWQTRIRKMPHPKKVKIIVIKKIDSRTRSKPPRSLCNDDVHLFSPQVDLQVSHSSAEVSVEGSAIAVSDDEVINGKGFKLVELKSKKAFCMLMAAHEGILSTVSEITFPKGGEIFIFKAETKNAIDDYKADGYRYLHNGGNMLRLKSEEGRCIRRVLWRMINKEKVNLKKIIFRNEECPACDGKCLYTLCQYLGDDDRQVDNDSHGLIKRKSQLSPFVPVKKSVIAAAKEAALEGKPVREHFLEQVAKTTPNEARTNVPRCISQVNDIYTTIRSKRRRRGPSKAEELEEMKILERALGTAMRQVEKTASRIDSPASPVPEKKGGDVKCILEKLMLDTPAKSPSVASICDDDVHLFTPHVDLLSNNSSSDDSEDEAPKPEVSKANDAKAFLVPELKSKIAFSMLRDAHDGKFDTIDEITFPKGGDIFIFRAQTKSAIDDYKADGYRYLHNGGNTIKLKSEEGHCTRRVLWRMINKEKVNLKKLIFRNEDCKPCSGKCFFTLCQYIGDDDRQVDNDSHGLIKKKGETAPFVPVKKSVITACKEAALGGKPVREQYLELLTNTTPNEARNNVPRRLRQLNDLFYSTKKGKRKRDASALAELAD